MPYKVIHLKGNAKPEEIEKAVNEMEMSGYTLVQAYIGPATGPMSFPKHVLYFRKI